jgi:HEPN domain-containing protein
MKRPHEQMRRWLEQAEHQLEVTDTLLESGFWSDVCFMAEQTAQMALKAFLYGRGQRHVLLHSIQELASECREVDAAFAEVIEWGKVLDRYYIPTMYPDALPSPAVPFRSFTQDDARQACRYAADTVELVKTHSER